MPSILLSLCALCVFFHLFLSSPFTKATGSERGFTTTFIHRDSPLSPFYNASITHYDRLHHAFLRSVSRLNTHFIPTSFSSNSNTRTKSQLIFSGGEYFMNTSIGTPPVKLIGIVDTGSDLSWIQCEPCVLCYKQNPPIFDPKRSSSYGNISCKSPSCTSLKGASCGSDKNTCDYIYTYGDNSYTEGNLMFETLTFGSSSGPSIGLDKVILGCGHENGGAFDPVGSGIIGLGGGPYSLISQLNNSKIKRKFSYYLAPTSSNTTSQISFGRIVSGPNVVTTKLVTKNPDTYYYVTLEGISVGNTRLPYIVNSSNDVTKGNMIIDSGTTLTFLSPDFHGIMGSELLKVIRLKRVEDPKGLLGFCFQTEGDYEFPSITAHFDGADVKLQTINMFSEVENGIWCWTTVPSDDISIYGNLAQANFWIGLDLEKRKVSFKPV